MNSILNALTRECLRVVFFILNKFIAISSALERRTILLKWSALKTNEAPSGFEGQQSRLLEAAKNSGEEYIITKTSGTRNIPKEVPFSKSRLRYVEKSFLKSMILLTSKFSGRKTFFVMASMDKDSSLTSGMMNQKSPTRVELLQAPYRYLMTTDGLRLRQNVGDLAARFIVLVVSSPRFLYATNPSTLTHFFDEVKSKWPHIAKQIWKLNGKSLKQIEEKDGLNRLKKMASLESAPEVEVFLPKLLGVITWDGGYVAPFIKRLKEMLPKSVEHIPMYSMSTETIETLPHLIDGKIYYLPSMANTYPEFLKGDKIFAPEDVSVGETYTLLVSNTYGLIRYDTQDEFLVTGKVGVLPDLRFIRRRNVTASMMGEKITEAQCELLYQTLKKDFNLDSLYPTLWGRTLGNRGQYILGLIGPSKVLDLKLIASKAEEILGTINQEYQDKVKSGRLLGLTAETMSLSEFAKLMGQEYKWESQFKVMPLYEKPIQ